MTSEGTHFNTTAKHHTWTVHPCPTAPWSVVPTLWAVPPGRSSAVPHRRGWGPSSESSWRPAGELPGLVMTNIAIENHQFLWENLLFQWQFSSSLRLFTRGYGKTGKMMIFADFLGRFSGTPTSKRSVEGWIFFREDIRPQPPISHQIWVLDLWLKMLGPPQPPNPVPIEISSPIPEPLTPQLQPLTPNPYPLVNVYITIENHHFWWRKLTISTEPFSIANCESLPEGISVISTISSHPLNHHEITIKIMIKSH